MVHLRHITNSINSIKPRNVLHNRYNLRSLKRSRQSTTTNVVVTASTGTRVKRRKLNNSTKPTNNNGNTGNTDTNGALWAPFNKYQEVQFIDPQTSLDIKKEWISATKIKNHLLNDPLLDWLDLYYIRSTVDTKLPAHIQCLKVKQKKDELTQETNKLSVLFDMGNRFEDEVVNYLKKSFPGKVISVVKNFTQDVGEHAFKTTIDLMMAGTPIIDQAMLYNYKNMTYGVADLVVRSDYLNKIVSSQVLTNEELQIKAPKLKGDYFYTVIDIKWTTMTLCSDGKLIRNSARFPAYKGQLAVYNAALGQIQGYTPTTAYVLAKSWKCTNSNVDYQGYNCFDLLGHIDYSEFDQPYIQRSADAIKWVREVRYNGHHWSYKFPPTRSELYPNMNNQYDTPFHRVKKGIANENQELTQIFMVGVKNRKLAHSKGVYKWSDPKCTPKVLGINGSKIGPIVSQIIKINQDTSNRKISPELIRHNPYDWQTATELDFYIDYESINGVFYNTKHIDIKDSKQQNGVLFMVGIGKGASASPSSWEYTCVSMDRYTVEEEKRVIQGFVDHVEAGVGLFMKKHGIQSRNLVRPNLFHWGHIERTMFTSCSKRHGGVWDSWAHQVNWIDMCSIFKTEPIVIKGAKKFGLKEVAKMMKSHGMIQTDWSEEGPTDGLGAMLEATQYYKYISEYLEMTPEQQAGDIVNYSKQIEMFANIIKYNEIDCKAVWEIVTYLRENHTGQGH